MAKVAVVLSGCGVYDGAEIHESVLTLLALDRNNAEIHCFAPDIPQMHVVDHLKGEPVEGETRNVLTEAARIARGSIKDIKEARVGDFDALILPGGFGAAKNLSDFAVSGAQMTVNPDVLALCKAFADAGKPAGYMCIAPAMIARIYGEGATCTIGTDADTAAALESMGACHQACPVGDIVVDEQRKLVSTPAYMLATRISEAAIGIDKLVNKVLSFV